MCSYHKSVGAQEDQMYPIPLKLELQSCANYLMGVLGSKRRLCKNRTCSQPPSHLCSPKAWMVSIMVYFETAS